MTIGPDLNGRVAPLGRMGQAHEVAQAVLIMLGNDYMTGQTIMLNGGMAFVCRRRDATQARGSSG